MVSDLAADPLLQQRERPDPAVLPDDDLAVEHGAVGKRLRERDDLRKALADELLAARPDPHLAHALDQLRADAVVLPLDQPVVRGAEPGGEIALGDVELVRKEERIRLAEVERAGLGRRRQLEIALGARRRALVGVAHHALGDELGVDAGALGERALHEQPADADPELAADQLVEQEPPGRVELVPVRGDARFLLGGREAAQRQQPLLDPLGEAEVARARRRRQHVRDGLGEVADRLVAGVEQPVVDAGAAARGRPQDGVRHHLAGLAAGEEVHRPRGVARRRFGEVALQRVDLGERRGAAVELGEEAREALHASASSACTAAAAAASVAPAASSSSWPYSVTNADASNPCSASQRTITAS